VSAHSQYAGPFPSAQFILRAFSVEVRVLGFEDGKGRVGRKEKLVCLGQRLGGRVSFMGLESVARGILF